ncbi:MAG: zinc-ribbon domain-containing protein [Proteobacteria bacterium]|nr:zinc-ribbon domain-containing protein [Pseudomonadota bacterium]
MILTCPQCETRYQVDGSKFPAAGRSVRCAKCGNVWHQLGPEAPQPDPEAEVAVQEPEPPAPVRSPEPPPPRVAAFAPSVETPSDDEPDEVAPAPAPRRRVFANLGIVGGWIFLILIVLVIGWAGVSFRDSVATWLPQTSSLYAAAGLPVNPQGIDFLDVAYQTQTEDGQVVLAVTGKIVNRSDHELTVPLVRVALFDMDRHELYHWTFVPGVSTLKPGESAKFRTRLSSPPAGTHNLEVRFAKAGE